MSKKGRRTKRDEKLLAKVVAEAQAKIAACAVSEAVSEEVIRERMIALARVRDQMDAHYAGTGTVVTDVTYDAKTDRISVTIAPAQFGTFTPASRARTAIFEVERALGPARTAFPLIQRLK